MPIHREADGTTQALSSSESDWVDLSAGTTSDSTGVELTVKATDLRRMVKNLPPPRWLQVNDKNYPDSKSYTEDEDYAGDEDYSHDEVDDNVDRVDFDLGPPHPAAPGALSPATLKFDDVSSKIPTLTAPDSTVTIKGKKQKQKITGTAPVVPHSSVAVEECLERERLKAFWISLDEAERRKLVKIEREGALKMLEEQQRRDCAHTASGGDDDTHLHTARNILAVLDDLLKNNGQKFLEVTGPLVEYWENQEGRDAGDCEGGLDKKTEHGRCIFVSRMLEKRVLVAYREHVTQERKVWLLQELEEGDRAAHEREVKKAQENRKKRDKKRERRLSRETEKAKRNADRLMVEQAKREAQEDEARRKREEELRREVERKAREEEEERRRLAVEEEAKERERKMNKEKRGTSRRTGSHKPGASPGTTEISPSNQPFYPAGNDRPHLLGFARFDDELLRNIQDLNVRVLENAAWQPNRDEELCGGFGYVERAVWNNRDIAVKFLRGAQTDSGIARGRRSFRREIVAWSKLTHANILPFLGVVCVDNMYLGMASPYMPNGSAPKYIARNPEANVLHILRDVAAGMRHLATQSPPIAHGDLKGVNVLIDQDGRARICDFGLSRFMKGFKSADTAFGGTIRWMAPEQILSETMLVSLSADVFSWGMLALELMTGSIPWHDVQQDAAVVIKVGTLDQRPDRPVCAAQRCHLEPKCVCLICDNDLWALIQQCWLKDPNKRPTAAKLCRALARFPGTKRLREQLS